nr:hypothetical protein CFP56_62529 [Quercus suber]
MRAELRLVVECSRIRLGEKIGSYPVESRAAHRKSSRCVCEDDHSCGTLDFELVSSSVEILMYFQWTFFYFVIPTFISSVSRQRETLEYHPSTFWHQVLAAQRLCLLAEVQSHGLTSFRARFDNMFKGALCMP